MKNEKMNKAMKVLIMISMAAILVGAIFQLQHYPNGSIIFWCGIWSNFILSSFEISRLREIIAKSGSTNHPCELK